MLVKSGMLSIWFFSDQHVKRVLVCLGLLYCVASQVFVDCRVQKFALALAKRTETHLRRATDVYGQIAYFCPTERWDTKVVRGLLRRAIE